MPIERDVESFVRLIDALRPQLANLVFVGGWAHRLHRLHPYAQPLDYAPLMTKDVDVAMPLRGFPEADLRAMLIEAGFNEQLTAEHQPPIARYELGAAAGFFYAEFLTPLDGGEYRRDGTPDVTAKIGNVSAQKLRYLEVLLQSPWSVRLTPENGFPFREPTEVQIPNAASYLAQKILIHGKRRPEEQARDVLYIHDTIEAFGQTLDRIQTLWREHIGAALHANARGIVEAAHATLFGGVTDAIRNASLQASGAGQDLKPETIRLVGEVGLRQIFG